jgi:hypothetical protein
MQGYLHTLSPLVDYWMLVYYCKSDMSQGVMEALVKASQGDEYAAWRGGKEEARRRQGGGDEEVRKRRLLALRAKHNHHEFGRTM